MRSSKASRFYLAIFLFVAVSALATVPLRALLGIADASGSDVGRDDLLVALVTSTQIPVSNGASTPTPAPTLTSTPFGWNPTPTFTLSPQEATQTAAAATTTAVYEYPMTATAAAQATLGISTNTPMPTHTPTGTPTPFGWNPTPTYTLSPQEATQTAVAMTLEAMQTAAAATTTAVYEYPMTATAAAQATLGIPTNTPMPTNTMTPTSSPVATSTEQPTPGLETPDPATPQATIDPTVTSTPTSAPTLVATVVVSPQEPTTATVGAEQGLAADQAMGFSIPQGAVEVPTNLKISVYAQSQPTSARYALGTFVFVVSAEQGGEAVYSLTFAQPITLTIDYRDEDITGLDESVLALRYLDEENGEWNDGGVTVISRDPVNNRLVVLIAHLTTFGLLDPSERIRLPITHGGK